MSRLQLQRRDEWRPLREAWCIGVLDRTPAEISAALGWTWDVVDEDGLGTMFYAALAWDGRSRFMLSSSGVYPGDGVAIEVEASEDPARARADFLQATALPPAAFLAIAEGDTWFARWDAPHNAGVRPATAAPRQPYG